MASTTTTTPPIANSGNRRLATDRLERDDPDRVDLPRCPLVAFADAFFFCAVLFVMVPADRAGSSKPPR
jgi:hypothetical protein